MLSKTKIHVQATGLRLAAKRAKAESGPKEAGSVLKNTLKEVQINTQNVEAAKYCFRSEFLVAIP